MKKAFSVLLIFACVLALWPERASAQTEKFNVTIAPAEHGTVKVMKGTEAFNGGEVDKDTKLEITATPEENYQVKSVTFAGKPVELKDDKYELTVTEAGEIKVEFEAKPAATEEVTITITVGENGTAKVMNGSAAVTTGTKVNKGSKLEVIPAPAEGYQVKSVTFGGVAVELTDGKYEVTVSEDGEIKVEFEAKPAVGEEFEITIAAVTAEQGEVKVMKGTEPFNGGKVAKDTKLVITVTPAAAYQVKSVTFADEALAANAEGKYELTVTKAGEIKVEFEAKPAAGEEFEITIAAVAAEQGEVKVMKGTDPFTGGKVAKDTKLVITVTAKEGFQVKSVTFGDETLTANAEGNYELTVTKAGEIKVELEAKGPAGEEFEIKIATPKNGKLAAMVDGKAFTGGKLAKDVKITLTATPDKGFELKEITYAGAKVAAKDGKYEVTVTKAGEIAATFAAKTPSAVESVLFAGVTASPNPFATELHLTGVEAAERVSVLSATGSVIRIVPCTGAATVSLDLSDLHAGVYFVLVERGAERKLLRVVKQ